MTRAWLRHRPIHFAFHLRGGPVRKTLRFVERTKRNAGCFFEPSKFRIPSPDLFPNGWHANLLALHTSTPLACYLRNLGLFTNYTQ